MSDINEEQKRLYKRAEENDIKLLQEENKKLKDLCDKYEEEHNNEFQCWKRDRKELLDKRNRINKAIEYIEYEMPCLWEVDEIFEDIDGKDYNTWKEYDENKLLNILKGDNK